MRSLIGALAFLVVLVLGSVSLSFCVNVGIADLLEATKETPTDGVQLVWGLVEAIGLPLAIILVCVVVMWDMARRRL